MKTKSVIGVLMLSAMILVVIYLYREYNREAPALDSLEPAAVLSTSNILDAFVRDEQLANKLYLGKVLEINGTVRSIENDPSGRIIIILGEDPTPSSVRCSMDSIHTINLVEFPIHKLVSLKGICAGYTADELGLGADLVLNRCIVLKRR